MSRNSATEHVHNAMSTTAIPVVQSEQASDVIWHQTVAALLSDALLHAVGC